MGRAQPIKAYRIPDKMKANLKEAHQAATTGQVLDPFPDNKFHNAIFSIASNKAAKNAPQPSQAPSLENQPACLLDAIRHARLMEVAYTNIKR